MPPSPRDTLAHPAPRPRFSAIRHVLAHLCARHGFEAAVLVGAEGLPLAAAPSPHDAEIVAALAASQRHIARQVVSQMHWAQLDEVNVVEKNGLRLIGRSFQVADQEFLLAGLLPSWRSYRKATTHAIAVICHAWSAPGRVARRE